jgi:hypothetical protein
MCDLRMCGGRIPIYMQQEIWSAFHFKGIANCTHHNSNNCNYILLIDPLKYYHGRMHEMGTKPHFSRNGTEKPANI